MVRERGFEPPRYCYRQPLKLVRLPVPPLPHREGTKEKNSKAAIYAQAAAGSELEPERALALAAQEPWPAEAV